MNVPIRVRHDPEAGHNKWYPRAIDREVWIGWLLWAAAITALIIGLLAGVRG